MTDKKVHTTNYFDTFIEAAEDTKANKGTRPISKGDKKSVGEMQYDLIAENPYYYTSDDVSFLVFADRNETNTNYMEAWKDFFSKGRPCLRTSPQAKSYGFGIHHDSEGKVALYGMETKEYQNFLDVDKMKKIKAMRSSKK